MSNQSRTIILSKPVDAKLVLVDDQGDTHHTITDEQFHRMGLVDRAEGYRRFCDMLLRAAGETEFSDLPPGFTVIRYIAECAFNYDHDYDDGRNAEQVDPEDERANLRMDEEVRALIPLSFTRPA